MSAIGPKPTAFCGLVLRLDCYAFGPKNWEELGLHELFHIYFGEAFQWPSLEEHIENEVVIDMTTALQNEGIATHISHQLTTRYPYEEPIIGPAGPT